MIYRILCKKKILDKKLRNYVTKKIIIYNFYKVIQNY